MAKIECSFEKGQVKTFGVPFILLFMVATCYLCLSLMPYPNKPSDIATAETCLAGLASELQHVLLVCLSIGTCQN